MKLEYLDDITDGGKYPNADPDTLLRVFSFDQQEVQELINHIQDRVIDKKESLEISTLHFVKPLNCKLKLEISTEDVGIDLSSERRFVCRLSLNSYINMLSNIRAFCDMNNGMSGYIWLYDPAVEKIDLLFSVDGSW